jgi:hypothetical protein
MNRRHPKRRRIDVDDTDGTFDALPDEVIRRLSDFIPPRDLDGFRLTSLRHWQILHGRHRNYTVRHGTIDEITKTISKVTEGNEEHMTITIGNRDFNSSLAKKFKTLCSAGSLRRLDITMYPGYLHPRSRDPLTPGPVTNGAILAGSIAHINAYATSLTTLSLSFPSGRRSAQHVDAIDSFGLRAIGGLSILTHLVALNIDLFGAKIGNDGARALSALKDSGTLRHLGLDLTCNQIGPEGANAIATLKDAPSLKTLTLFLESNAIGDGGAVALASLGEAHALDSLELQVAFCQIGDFGVAAFAKLTLIPSLTLGLSHNGFGAAGVERLGDMCASDHIVKLSLDLSHNMIGPIGIAVLVAKFKSASALEWLYLDLARTRLHDIGGTVPLVEAPALSALHLFLDDNRIHDEGLRVLMGMKQVRRLHLSLAHNKITQNGMDALGELLQKWKESSVFINLPNNRIRDGATPGDVCAWLGIASWMCAPRCAHCDVGMPITHRHRVNLYKNPMSAGFLKKLIERSSLDFNGKSINVWSEREWNALTGIKRELQDITPGG